MLRVHLCLVFMMLIKNKACSGRGVKVLTWENLPGLRGIQVPDSFCITTEAFKRIIEGSPVISGLLDQLSLLKGGRAG